MPKDKVFINCPYDEKYKELFFALIYMCEVNDLEPIFAACDESSSDRMTNIYNCIIKSKYAIHDISRIKDRIPRFNMPFELGMYYMHIREKAKNKKMLILEGEKNKSDKTISDLSGLEIKCHNNDVEGIFRAARPFFAQINTTLKDSASKMYNEYICNCIRKI